MIAVIATLVLSVHGQEPDWHEFPKKPGYISIFNGKNLDGWKGFKRPDPPASWKAENGELTVKPGRGDGGDISTVKEYSDFDLIVEWNTTKDGNSGIIYRSGDDYGAGWMTGPEYQLYDDFRGGTGKADLHSAGALYDVFEPAKFVTKPPGEWNVSRIVVVGKHIQHFLNGAKVVDCVVDSAEWMAHVGKSKFKEVPLFGRKPKGYVLLQDHGHELRFRNIRIREL